MGNVLEIKQLQVKTKDSKLKKGFVIVDDLSIDVKNEEIVGIVGESGCGKSVAMMSVLRLFGKSIEISHGDILFEDKNLTAMKSKQVRNIAGKEIGMIFQEPMKYLNPLLPIHKQLSEPMKIHTNLSKAEIQAKSIDLLDKVGIKNSKHIMKCLPNELSGGMRQRVLIAMAISCNPKLLIADEPTTALDVTVQAQIIEIIKKLVKENHMSLIIISHDLGVISELAKKIVVMYAGEIVEMGKADDIFSNPLHPYTEQLLISAKEINSNKKVLTVLEGNVPRIEEKIRGCRFQSRCRYATENCKKDKIDLIEQADERKVRCIRYVEGK